MCIIVKLERDYNEHEYRVKLMEQKLRALQWPSDDEELWIPECAIIRVVHTPVTIGQ